jgi:uncharacterized protein YjeT (DUF2065 family)
METAIFIARIFGLCYLVIGVGLLLNQKFWREVIEDFSKNAATVLFGGIFALVVGVVIVLTHNVWVGNWTVIITIIGWIALIKGIWIIVFPSTVSKFMQAYWKNESILLVQSIGALVFGVVLTYFGFFSV